MERSLGEKGTKGLQARYVRRERERERESKRQRERCSRIVVGRQRTSVYLTTSSAPPCRMEQRLRRERNPTRQTRLHLTEWNLSTLASTSNKIQIRRGSAGDPLTALLLPDQFKPLGVKHLRVSDSSLLRKERRVSIDRDVGSVLNKRRVIKHPKQNCYVFCIVREEKLLYCHDDATCLINNITSVSDVVCISFHETMNTCYFEQLNGAS